MRALLSLVAGLSLAAASTARAAGTAAAAAPPAAAPASAPQPSGETASEEGSEAGEGPPTLESRIPPVSGDGFHTAHKFEVTVGAGFSLDDAFIEKIIPELSLGYHLDENFYLGIRGGYAVDFNAGHVNACDATGNNCTSPSSTQEQQLPGNLVGVGAVQFAWTSFYGKVNVLAEKVFHFDFSLLMDAGVLAVGSSSSSGSTSIAPEFSPGLGEHFFFTNLFAVAVELRDMMYVSSGLQHQLMFHLGLTFLL